MNFDTALARVASFGPSIKVSNDDKLGLYALFKQARNGNAPAKDKPSSFNYIQYTKFSAWEKLSGMSQEEAERQYVELVSRLDPNWSTEILQQKQETKEQKIIISTPRRVKSVEEEEELISPPPRRTLSLDRNFTVMTQLPSSLEKVLKNNQTTTRPRGRSLDLQFLLPLVSETEVGEAVKQMVLQPPTKQTKRIYEHLIGVGNARDFGGLPALTWDGKKGRIRSKLIVRSAHFSEATHEDATWLIQEFGLKTLIDLRGEDSGLLGPLAEHFPTHHHHDTIPIENRGRFSLPLITRSVAAKMVWKNATLLTKIRLILLYFLSSIVSFIRKLTQALPLITTVSPYIKLVEDFLMNRIRKLSALAFSAGSLGTLYSTMMLHGNENIRYCLDILTRKDRTPAAFFCSFGKDRTGIIAALLLHAIGVPREIIIEDFVLSHSYINTERGTREWNAMIQVAPELAHRKIEWGGVQKEDLITALDEIESTYGSLDEYFRKVLGLDDEWKQRVREHFVLPDDEEQV